MKVLKGLLRFWYDFVVGDSVVLALGGVATLAIGSLLVLAGWNAVAEIAMPSGVLLTLGLSLPWRSG